MKKTMGAVCVLLSTITLGACGGSDNDISAVDACKSAVSTICTRAFQCPGLTTTYLNSEDCKTGMGVNCTEAQQNCGAGQTYHPDMAQACVDQFGQFNCTQLEGVFAGTQAAPAACSQTCTTS